jgi:hypothetical protein
LIRDLAMDAVSQAELAEKYGVAQPSISAFKLRHADEIEAVRNDLLSDVHDETVGLWIVDKVARIAEYQQDVDDANEELEARGFDTHIIKAKHNAMKAVAEELGALPTRGAPIQTDTEQHVVYRITQPVDLD